MDEAETATRLAEIVDNQRGVIAELARALSALAHAAASVRREIPSEMERIDALYREDGITTLGDATSAAFRALYRANGEED